MKKLLVGLALTVIVVTGCEPADSSGGDSGGNDGGYNLHVRPNGQIGYGYELGDSGVYIEPDGSVGYGLGF